MAYHETHTKGYGSRLSGSIKKIGTGLALFIGATALLFWNEGRAVKRAETIKEAQGPAIHIDNVSEILTDLDGQLIHATAIAESHDTLRDDIFGVAVPAIKLIREVEYYQWIEESKTEKHEKFGGSEETVTTYSYKKKWMDEPINSDDFHDPAYRNSNFVIAEFDDEKKLAENVSFGAYTLPDFLKNSIRGEKSISLSLDSAHKADINRTILESIRSAAKTDVKKRIDSARQESDYLVVKGNTVYLGLNTGNPQIGDVRVSFKAVPSTKVSLIAKVSGDTFEPFVSADGNSFSKLEMGAVSMDNMFHSADNDNSLITWLLRLVGLLMVITGLKMTFEILSMLFKWFPALGSIVDTGVGLVCGVVGFIWSLLIISIAWIFYRPIIGITLIVIAAIIGWFLWKKSRDKAKSDSVSNEPEEPLTSTPTI